MIVRCKIHELKAGIAAANNAAVWNHCT